MHASTEPSTTTNTSPHSVTHDLIGVGFGPSNLALAIALEEHCGQRLGPARFLFLEKQPEFTWHGNMLLSNSRMQIAYLKDLATLRNPRSRFTFINYLHEKARLSAFINLQSHYPTRREYNDYLRWAASHFHGQCAYGETVTGIEPVLERDEVVALQVHSRDGQGETQSRRTRNVILGAGGTPHVPPVFTPLHRTSHARLFHSSQYLARVASLSETAPRRVAVVGGGQSAAEIFLDLAEQWPQAQVDLIMRGRALKPADSSPFVNEIFDPQFTDFIYAQPVEQRERILDEFRNTNYAVVDDDLIARIYDVLYQQRVGGHGHHALLSCHEIQEASADGDRITLHMHERLAGRPVTQHYDVVVLATGYERRTHEALLSDLAPWLDGLEGERDYRLRTRESFQPGIYLQGYCEPTHGLSDTLLSILATRSSEIATSLLSRAPLQTDAPAQTTQASRVAALAG
ncbi:pandorabactin biosynthesis N-hydroxylase PanF [Pandoraea commovens]|uniref:Lysine N(6)-hydroxylase/L-ornithine N(5)-oxygenase family protein n=1 Tax=Pandoraea commovens TaxID=2508289 RepID=A0ABY5QD21_9BURK|nr:lysine N(6)-hydroxylase/L-ornithine N(5)-oxygenase family protein [Pandoraea commovens]UVA77783.1 lysine N(6)-hydroxylase/L-ornithine N(5)-oxygenase family protein [Pandoraea commovens]